MAYVKRLSFGAARFATNIFAAFTAYYLMSFCTDVALIPPAATAAIMFGLRIWDAVNDQFIGVFINRNHFKDGKYRPYFKWCTLPFAVTFALICFIPNFSVTGRIVYIALMLAVCNLFSSTLNIAELSMLPYLAEDDINRTKFVSFSNIGAILAYLTIGTFMMPLVNFMGADKRMGFALALALFATVSVPAHLWAYFGLKELKSAAVSGMASIRDMLSAIVKNRRLLLFLSGYCIYSMADAIKAQMTYYYMTYNMGRQDLLPITIMAGILSSLAMQPFIPHLIKLAGKEVLVTTGLFAASGASMLMLAAGTRPLPLICCVVLYGLCAAVSANLGFTVIASFNDEMLERKKIPMSEILISIMALSWNIGAALVGGMAPLVLDAYGYSAQTDLQTVDALAGIKMLYIISTAAAMALAGVFMLLFCLSRRIGSRE